MMPFSVLRSLDISPFLAGLSGLAFTVAISGCTTLTSPEARIEKEPAMFDAIPEKYREAVRRGRVEEGMPRDAVYLAWGKPHEVSESSRDGRRLQTWTYYGAEAIPVQTVGFGYYGGHCRGPVYDFGFDYARREYLAAVVEFEKDRVVYWKRSDRR